MEVIRILWIVRWRYSTSMTCNCSIKLNISLIRFNYIGTSTIPKAHTDVRQSKLYLKCPVIIIIIRDVGICFRSIPTSLDKGTNLVTKFCFSQIKESPAKETDLYLEFLTNLKRFQSFENSTILPRYITLTKCSLVSKRIKRPTLLRICDSTIV